jgi:hypothetical protein
MTVSLTSDASSTAVAVRHPRIRRKTGRVHTHARKCDDTRDLLVPLTVGIDSPGEWAGICVVQNAEYVRLPSGVVVVRRTTDDLDESVLWAGVYHTPPPRSMNDWRGLEERLEAFHKIVLNVVLRWAPDGDPTRIHLAGEGITVAKTVENPGETFLDDDGTPFDIPKAREWVWPMLVGWYLKSKPWFRTMKLVTPGTPDPAHCPPILSDDVDWTTVRPDWHDANRTSDDRHKDARAAWRHAREAWRRHQPSSHESNKTRGRAIA